MVEKIIEFSARNKFLIILITIAIIAIGIWALQNQPVDAIPDLSDTQVIVYSRWDRSPDILEDQVTYPIITALLGTPKVKAIPSTPSPCGGHASIFAAGWRSTSSSASNPSSRGAASGYSMPTETSTSSTKFSSKSER